MSWTALPFRDRAPDGDRRRLVLSSGHLRAEHHGMPWGIWSFGPIFIYDLTAGGFYPDLLAALVG